MNSEITKEFRELFRLLPEQVQNTTRKNYKLWKKNPSHPSLQFKKLNTKTATYSVRAGTGWRVLGTLKKDDTMVWFWVGSHSEYEKILETL